MSTPRHAAPVPQAVRTLMAAVLPKAQAAGVFGGVELKDEKLVCKAKASEAPAAYRVEFDAGKVYISLVMADRWQSESIESDLEHTGDKMEDLVEEELVDLGVAGVRLPVEHFRSDDKLFTFRSPLPFGPDQAGDPVSVERTLGCLLAYEQCFRRLGDMNAKAEQD